MSCGCVGKVTRIGRPSRCPERRTLNLVITLDGRQYGTAAEIAVALGPDVTEAMVRAWARRSTLTAYRVGRTVYYPLDQAATVERDKRLSTRGRKRAA
jgi:hypothetical protein